MTEAEVRLDVTPRSHYGLTQRPTICWVEPSPWWTVPSMPRSLFTILLRVAANYRGDFESALYSHPYTADTRYAVGRFFSGCTKYTARKRGWYKQFSIAAPAEVDTLLVRP